MLACWCCKAGNAPSVLSLGTFIKHFPIPKPKSFSLHGIQPKRFTTTACLKLTHFETLSSRQKDQINLYVDSLLQWNQKMRLTAVTEVNEVMDRHIEDSLAILSPLENSYVSNCNASCDRIKLVDVGSGAGLPGLVLAVARPDWKITLLESMNKRCIFLEHAVSVLGLSNVQIVRGRAEEVGQDTCLREKFDVAVARAVAEMRVLAEYCLPLVRVGGLFVAPKGHNPQEEVKNAERAVKLLGASILTLSLVNSHSPYGQRTAIVCVKHHRTPRKYPRDPGTPTRTPL